MSSVLEILSLNELNIRKEHLLKQLQKVEIQINKVKKDNISKNNEEQYYPSNNIDLIPEQYNEDNIINENDIKTIKNIEIEKILNKNIVEIHKENSSTIPINEPINIKTVKIKINIKKK
jgi:hypothetical protein